MADAYYFSTPAMLPLDGANNATTFPNYGWNKTVFTPIGAAQISTLQSKYGGASLYLNGAAYLASPLGEIELSTGDFTVEMWVRVTDLASFRGFFLYGDAGSNGGRVQLGLQTVGAIQLYVQDDGGGSSGVQSANGTIVANTWYHIAAQRVGTTLNLYLDGTLVGSNANVSIAPGRSTYLGIARQGGVIQYFAGHIDDVRITKGMARYSANFTPPAAHDIGQLAIVKRLPSLPFMIVATGLPITNFKYSIGTYLLADTIHGGKGILSGTVKEAGSPDIPVMRKVRLHRKIDGMAVRETWSKLDGSYSFKNIAMQPYYVIGFDHTGNLNAVIKDSIVPELMP